VLGKDAWFPATVGNAVDGASFELGYPEDFREKVDARDRTLTGTVRKA
jgi:hypothetical protein